MREWGVMLGPFLIWAAHFALVYGLASVADIGTRESADVWRAAAWFVTAVCLAGIAAHTFWSLAQSQHSALARKLCVTGAVIGFIAIVWQSIPLFIAN